MVVRKEMAYEIIEYIASDEDSMVIKKYNLNLDGTLKKKRVMDLNKIKIHGRYWLDAGKLFKYLVKYKYFEVMDDFGIFDTDDLCDIN